MNSLFAVVLLVAILLGATTEAVRVSVDVSKLRDPRHLEAMEELTISTFLAVPTTTTFTLHMNHAAIMGMSHLLNGSVEDLESGQRQQQQQQLHQRLKEQQQQQQQQHERHKEQQQQQHQRNEEEQQQQEQHQRHKEQQQHEGHKEQQQQQQQQKAGKSLFSITKASGLPSVDSHSRAHVAGVEDSDLGVHPPGVADSKLGAPVAGVEVSNVGAHLLSVNDSDLGIHQIFGENSDVEAHLLGVEDSRASQGVEDSDLGTHLPDVEDLADVRGPDVKVHMLGVEGPSLGDHVVGVEDSDVRAPLIDVNDSGMNPVDVNDSGIHPAGVNDSGIHPAGVNASGIHPAGVKDSGIHPAGVKDSGIHPAGVNDSGIHPAGVKDLDLHTHPPDVEDFDYGARPVDVKDSDLWACVAGLSKENADVVRSLVSGEVAGPLLTLAPTDEEFPEALELLRSLRTCRWLPSSPVPQPKVEALEVGQKMPEEVEHRLEALTSVEEVEGGRGASHSSSSPMQVDQHQLTHMMGSVFSITRNHETAPLDKLVATLYIGRKFDSFGLMVVNHVFSAAEYFLWFDRPLQGTNVVGVLAGTNWGTPADEPLILGAHLDTVPGTPGLDDDGSGLAALVEASRVLSSSGCVFTHTIFFVAFDLEEIGTQGSLVFVKDYLSSAIMERFGIRRVGGAIILDCVSNWDPQPGTQDFPETWTNLLPEAGRRISQRNHTGDFAAIIYRTQVDAHLAHRLAQYYKGLDQPQYRLELLGLSSLGADLPDISVLKTHFDFLRSDHLRFWYLNDTGPYNTIPAVLFTDTGPYRGTMRRCYHGACDGPLVQGKDNLGLLTKVTQAVVWTMADLAQARCGPRGTISTPALFTLLGTVH